MDRHWQNCFLFIYYYVQFLEYLESELNSTVTVTGLSFVQQHIDVHSNEDLNN